MTRFIGTHHYDWMKAGRKTEAGREHSEVGRREKNLAVYRDRERMKVEKHQQNLLTCGYQPKLTDAQMKAGARRICPFPLQPRPLA